MTEKYYSLSASALLSRAIGSKPLLSPEEEISLAKRIKKGTLNPNRDWKKEPIELTSDGLKALNTLCEGNLRFLMKRAVLVGKEWRIGHGDTRILGLFQAGYFGLRQAAWKFDPQRKCRFTTMAKSWIDDSVKRHIMDTRYLKRVPVYAIKELNSVKKVRDRLYNELERDPTILELSRVTGYTTKEITQMFEDDASMVSADVPNEEEHSVYDVYPATSPDIVDLISRERTKEAISKFLSTLDSLELDSVFFRWEVFRTEPFSHPRLAPMVGVSREKTRMIEKKVEKKLRRLLELQECEID